MAEAQEIQEHQPSTQENALECPVCLQTCVHPARLPCGHIFCFLCVKGVANLSKRCAMCRQEIPLDYLENPLLLEELATPADETESETYHWFYEGRGGWWQYDERTNAEMEAAFKEKDKICELLIAGFLYVIDFRTMLQFRRNDPSRRRRIKRDLANVAKKGIAGIRTEGPNNEIVQPNEDLNGIRPLAQNLPLNRRVVYFLPVPPIPPPSMFDGRRPVHQEPDLTRSRYADTPIDLTVSSDSPNMEDDEMDSIEISTHAQNSTSNQPAIAHYFSLPPVPSTSMLDDPNLTRSSYPDLVMNPTGLLASRSMEVEMDSVEITDEELESDEDTLGNSDDNDGWQLIDRLREVDLNS